MTYFSVKIDGLNNLYSAFKSGNRIVQPLVNEAMVKAVNLVKNYAQKVVVYKTGTLRRSIYTVIKKNGFRGEVNQDSKMVPYGPVIEFGSKPYIIRAKYKKVLSDGTRFFGKSVRHPGIKARPFMKPAFENNLNEIRRLFDNALLQIVRKLSSK